MKHLIPVAFLMALFSFASCLDDHENPIDLSLKVGNVYYSDGSIWPVDYYKAEGVQPVGIVTAVGGPNDKYRALVMALEDIGTAYYLNTLDEDIAGISSDLTTFDGKENTAALLYAAVSDTLLTPASALLCSSYIAGGISAWHLPSVAEFRTVSTNYPAITATLRALDMAKLGDCYQTSTTDGTSNNNSKLYNYIIELPKGNTTSAMKTESHVIRPFIILK